MEVVCVLVWEKECLVLEQVGHESVAQLFDVIVFVDEHSDAASMTHLQVYHHQHLIILKIVLSNVSVIEAEVHDVFANITASLM